MLAGRALPPPAAPPVGYLPGLDGLRAIAVVAVLLYHAGLRSFPGGFLGVEVFFVISGYLITLLLTKEHARSSTISLRAFWGRRARRLLAALYAVLAVTSVVMLTFHRDEVRQLRAQLGAALTYVTNWYFIVTEQSYFAVTERPSPLQHLWSLAIEEQFYLLWPVLLLGLLRLSGGRHRSLAGLITVAAAGSAVWMAVLYAPALDPSRVYYGTDTRATGLLLGAALALVWRPSPAWRDHDDVSRVALDLSGIAAIGLLVVCFCTIHEYDRFLYQGGFAVVAILSVVAIGAAVHPATVLGRQLLANRILTWVGVRSYSLYLWHWPIFVFTRPEIDVPWATYPTLALRLVLTVVAADLCYRFIEVPIRNGALTRSWNRARLPWGRRMAGPVASASIAGLLLIAVTVVGTSPMAKGSSAALIAPAALSGGGPGPPSTVGAAAPDDAGRAASPTSSATNPDARPVGPKGTTTTTTPRVVVPGTVVTVLGDSVLVGAQAAVEYELIGAGYDVDFRGRPAVMLHEFTADLLAAGRPVGDTVIVGLGHNSLWERERGSFDHWSTKFDTEADELISTLRRFGAERVIWVTLREPSESVVPPEGRRQFDQYCWYFPYVNERLDALAARNPRVVLADWAAVSNEPGLTYDAFHLTDAGMALMIDVIMGTGAL